MSWRQNDLRPPPLAAPTSIKRRRESYLFLPVRVGFPLRFVFAILRSSALLIDLYMLREAPLRDDLERLPRFAESAAPAAICCFFDFAGTLNNSRAEAKPDWRVGRRAAAIGSKPVRPSTR